MRFRWGSVKSAIVVLFGKVATRVPLTAARSIARTIGWILPETWGLPGNPVRESCRDLARIAEASGHRHVPRTIYRDLATNIGEVLRAFIEVYYRGPAAAEPWLAIDAAEMERLHELARPRGLVIAVPHNVASVFTAIGIPKTLRPLVVARNRTGERKSRVAREAFERAGIDVLFVRDMTSTAVVRAFFKALRESRTLIVALDYFYRKRDAVKVSVFGHPREFAPWAATLAARRSVPFVPVYPRIDEGRVCAWIGEPLVDRDPGRLLTHFARSLEAWILRDPGNWAFLVDKRWRRHLREAARKLSAGE